MGLNFNYRIYVEKEKLEETLKCLNDKSLKESSPIEFKDGKFYKVEYPHLPPNKQKRRIIQDLLKESDLGGFNFYFESDDKILEYILRDMCSEVNPEHEISSKASLDDKNYLIGNIDITIEDYSKKIPNIIEICFTAVTSKMSILFEESKSIEFFFKSLCKEVDAKYGCLDKEHHGYKLIWFEGKEYNINLPHSESNSSNEPFRKYGFIPVLKMITKKK